MIVVRLMGGLGNQMFQYAAGKRLATHHGTQLELDLTAYDDQANIDTPRSYELGCFALNAPKANPRILPQPPAIGKKAKLKALVHRLGRPRSHLITLDENGHGFKPQVLKAPDHTYLVGFWQCEKYFLDVADHIRADFELKEPPAGRNATMLQQIMRVNAVSLHVRRGDYVSNEHAAKFHGLQPLDYYKEAIRQLSTKVKNPHFFIFSDDPQWCKDNLKFDHPTTFVDHNPPDRGYEDMRLMRNCQHHIIANSSFSWWGAWLGNNPGRIVYAPKRWFNDPSIDTSDVAAKGWITL